jgi:hypothetical protein
MSKEEVIGLGVRKSVWGEYNTDTGASGGHPPCLSGSRQVQNTPIQSPED